MAIGIGGSSIISRALGAEEHEKATTTFGNQIALTVLITISVAALGLYFMEGIIPAFGGRGQIYPLAKTYYTIVLYGVPFLGLCMMGNSVIRAEGKPKFAMVAMIISSVANLLMDYVFIYVFDWGMTGAAWATTGSYLLCFVYVAYFFLSKNASLKPRFKHFVFKKAIVSEIGALGFVTLARQAATSITYLIMNSLLFSMGGEALVAVYAIVGRMLMFALFPVFGVTQGFLPIAGFNYGAGKMERVRESINTAILYASALATLVFIGLMVFPEAITALFLSAKNADADTQALNAYVLEHTPDAMRWVFAATPIIALQLISAAYFQAAGKAIPALLLTLSRQALLFIPLVFLLPMWLGTIGVWLAFPVSDVLATLITGYFLRREIKRFFS